jgi:hypothetical protein
MTTDNKVNPASGPSTFPPRKTEVPTHPGVTQPVDTENKSGANEIANRLAHKANKTEQEFGRENSNLFSK